MSMDNITLTPSQELAAWDEWKDICFVDGCPPWARNYLRRRIIDKMTLLLQRTGVAVGANTLLDDDEMISLFDQFLAYKDNAPVGIDRGRRTPAPVSDGRARQQFKQHKDYVWGKKAASSDPPMKVLNGKLLGPCGVIMDVIDWVLEKHCPGHFVTYRDPKTGKRIKRFKSSTSLHKPINDSQTEMTLEESLADKRLASPDEQVMHSASELQAIYSNLMEILSRQEQVVLLAYFLQIKASAPCVCAAIQRQKSAACAMLNGVQRKLSAWSQCETTAMSAPTLETYHALCKLLFTALSLKPTAEEQDFLEYAKRIYADSYA